MLKSKKRYVVNFPAHLADCEFNYRRLKRLMPNNPQEAIKDVNLNGVEDIKHQWRFIVGGPDTRELAIVLTVTELAKYTTTVLITVYPSLENHVSWGNYLASKANQEQPENISKQLVMENASGVKTLLARPLQHDYSLYVRLYHDANVAEVIDWDGHRHIRPRNEYPNKNMYQSDEKAQLNRFLGEILELCLTSGRILDEIALCNK